MPDADGHGKLLDFHGYDPGQPSRTEPVQAQHQKSKSSLSLDVADLSASSRSSIREDPAVSVFIRVKQLCASAVRES
jgi:hypothetical protein